ncbi:MAG: SDR family NAD(P)-dependent oxidoreductase [Austwickia sp.]|nr:SDR family NAD(P)-dependent oxidoreductase [Austwickia sp.]MBK8436661.1 SDR family NAD(P)-dependent oxidoreductase [Austwickia sp.]
MSDRGVAVVTGGSSGIGRACALRLAQDGYAVVVAARRAERVQEVATECGGRAVTCDVADPVDVARLVEAAGADVALLVNNAGGALGFDLFEADDLSRWEQMFAANVMGWARVTQGLLPALEAGDGGTIVSISSTAGLLAYERGAGYCAVKAAESMASDALRLELCGRPVRVCDIAPGMVKSEEFSLTRMGGDAERAAAVYAGVAEPLTEQDIAECVSWVAGLPRHVNIDKLTVRPVAQASSYKVHRQG